MSSQEPRSPRDSAESAPDVSPARASAAHRAAREAFISKKRHDLRTPINAIIGYSEMLLEDAQGAGSEALATDLERILRAGRVLLTTVNDMLDPAKIEAGIVDLSDMEALGAHIHHAMRQDINTVSGYSEMMQEDADDDGKKELASDLGRIHTSAARLLDQVNDIIAFTSVVAGEVEIEPKDETESVLVRDVATTIRRLDRERRGREEPPGHILIVDDSEMNRDMLARRLDRAGHSFDQAVDGREALDLISKNEYELVLLDILMPVMDGYEVLERLKSHEEHRHVPVIMLSALDQIDSVARCVAMGADDFLAKPFNPVLLKARINTCLQKKRFHDREQEYLEEIRRERAKSEKLLLNILPAPIAEQLKGDETTIAQGYDTVTILFSDLVGFTSAAGRIGAKELVGQLNEIFRAFDDLTVVHGVEKIKTIGDAYMVVGGAPTPTADHAGRVADMALDMLDAMNAFNERAPDPFEIRIGVNTGNIVAGVIGSRKFTYDLWGDTVNIASRMESHGVPGRIQVSQSTYELIKDTHETEERGTVEIKGKGPMRTYFLNRRV